MLDRELEAFYEDEADVGSAYADEFSEFEEEDEYETFLEDDEMQYFDYEGDEFWGGLKKLAQKVGGAVKSAAKKLAPLAKAHAGKIGALIGGALGGPAGAAVGGKIGGFVKNLEDEDDYDTEDEMEAVLPVAALDESLAESMAAAAVKSRPTDAQALGGAFAVQIMSKTPMSVRTMAPGIASATGRIAHSMAAHPGSKQLIRVLPTIVHKTAATLNQKARNGKPITQATAARVMTKHAKRTLGSEARLAQALASNVAGKRKLDQAAIARAEKYA